MNFFPLLFCLLSLGMISIVSTANNALLANIYAAQTTADTTIYAGSVVTATSTGVQYDLTGTYGTLNPQSTNAIPNSIDAILRVNGLSEALVAAAAIKISTGGTFNLDSPLNVLYTPLGVAFTNPTTGTQITPNMLMQHTTYLADVNWNTALTSMPTGPTPLATPILFNAFAENYFFTDATSKAFRPGIWATAAAGAAPTYNYSKSNVLLLAYVLNKIFTAGPLLGASTLQDYITALMLDPVGLASTSYEQENGTYLNPRMLTNSKRAQDIKTLGTIATILIHPAKYVDVMLYSTPIDIINLCTALFLNGTSPLYTLGTSMRSTVPVPSTSTAKTAFQSMQGKGVQYFDGPSLCSLLATQNYITNCTFTANSQIWGLVSVGQTTTTSFLCNDDILNNPVCVSTSHAYVYTDTPKSANISFTLAAAALQVNIAAQMNQVSPGNPGAPTGIFGFYVFLGVIGVFIFVPLAALLTEHIIQPSPMVSTGKGGGVQASGMGGIPAPMRKPEGYNL